MAKTNYTKTAERFLGQRRNIVILILLGLAIIFLPVLVLKGFSKKPEDTIRQDQIKIQKGDSTVIISEDGSVEYITQDGTYYDSLDKQTVTSFFSSIRTLARKYLNKAPPKDTSNGYWITLWLDGEQVTIFVEGTNEEIQQIIEELTEGLADESLSDLFEEIFSESPSSPTPGSFFLSPTPTLFVFATPTPPSGFNPVGSGSIEEDCQAWQEQGLSSTIIFHTVCLENITPTP